MRTIGMEQLVDYLQLRVKLLNQREDYQFVSQTYKFISSLDIGLVEEILGLMCKTSASIPLLTKASACKENLHLFYFCLIYPSGTEAFKKMPTKANVFVRGIVYELV